MSLGNIEYVNLETLAHTDYKIIDGQADIMGWNVVDESGRKIGKVKDLLFDPEHNVIRYVVLELDGEITGNEDKQVLIPIGLINLTADKKEVIIPTMNEHQYHAMPPFIIGEVTKEMEVHIRRAIASPAPNGIQEEVMELDATNFYQHHHFDRGSAIDEILIEKHTNPAVNNRDIEENTIQQLIENSDVNQLHQNQEIISESNTTDFNIQTIHGSYDIEPQDNGTYRVMRKGEKLGVIYAEAAEIEGVKWRTMDDIDEGLVNAIGEAITLHNSSSSDK